MLTRAGKSVVVLTIAICWLGVAHPQGATAAETHESSTASAFAWPFAFLFPAPAEAHASPEADPLAEARPQFLVRGDSADGVSSERPWGCEWLRRTTPYSVRQNSLTHYLTDPE